MSDQDRSGWRETREGPSARLIVAGMIVVVLVLFVLQNTDETDVDFLFLSGNYPLWVFTLVVAAVAFASGWLIGRGRARRATEDRRD
jgi:uncharacterized integral membrane protein